MSKSLTCLFVSEWEWRQRITPPQHCNGAKQMIVFTTPVAFCWSSNIGNLRSWRTWPQCSRQSLLNNGDIRSRVALIQLPQLSQSGGKQRFPVEGCSCCYPRYRFFEVFVRHRTTPNDDTWTGHQLFTLQCKQNSTLAVFLPLWLSGNQLSRRAEKTLIVLTSYQCIALRNMHVTTTNKWPAFSKRIFFKILLLHDELILSC